MAQPNKVTKKAMKEAEEGKTKGFKSVAELLKDLKESESNAKYFRFCEHAESRVNYYLCLINIK